MACKQIQNVVCCLRLRCNIASDKNKIENIIIFWTETCNRKWSSSYANKEIRDGIHPNNINICI